MGYRDTIAMVDEEKEVKKVSIHHVGTAVDRFQSLTDASSSTQIVGGQEVTEKKTWSYWHLSDYKWMSYKQ